MSYRSSMSLKIPTIFLFASLAFGLASWMLLSVQARGLAEQAVSDHGNAILSRLNDGILTPLFNGDTISVQVALKQATEEPHIHSASLFSVDGKLITRSGKPISNQFDTIEFKRTVEIQNTQAGIISVVIDSRPIYTKHRDLVIDWIVLWLSFTLLGTYLCYRFADQLSLRLRRLSEKLPGNVESQIDELTALETKVQPLLFNNGEVEGDTSNTYFYSVISFSIQNRHDLINQLNRENLDRLFEKLDYCVLRTLQLYGGTRIQGEPESICFTIRSTQCSKQHLLVCLMAVYSLQQLIGRLTIEQGINLEGNWTLSSQNITSAPGFYFEQGISVLKGQNAKLAAQLTPGAVALHCDYYSLEQLSSIAHFSSLDSDWFMLQGFPEDRQQLLEKQLDHLAGLCL